MKDNDSHKPDQQDNGWITIGRPGYVGHSHKRSGDELARTFGEGNWRIIYKLEGRIH